MYTEKKSSVVAAFVAALSVSVLACTSTPPPAPGVAPRFFTAADPALKPLPFSEAVQVGNLLFLSGRIGSVPGTLDLVPGGITAESKQALDDMRDVLERHGSSLEHVVKCTVFLADMSEWSAFNGIYRKYFTTHFPARSAFAVSGLADGARVEIECIAFVPGEVK